MQDEKVWKPKGTCIFNLKAIMGAETKTKSTARNESNGKMLANDMTPSATITLTVVPANRIKVIKFGQPGHCDRPWTV